MLQSKTSILFKRAAISHLLNFMQKDVSAALRITSITDMTLATIKRMKKDIGDLSKTEDGNQNVDDVTDRMIGYLIYKEMGKVFSNRLNKPLANLLENLQTVYNVIAIENNNIISQIPKQY